MNHSSKHESERSKLECLMILVMSDSSSNRIINNVIVSYEAFRDIAD